MAERPIKGYKLVALEDGRFGIATLNIPPSSTVVETGYQVNYRGKPRESASPMLQRTNRVQTIGIVPVGRPASEAVSRGRSIRSQYPLVYQVGQWLETEFDETGEKGNGIHFFWDENTPKLWSVLFK